MPVLRLFPTRICKERLRVSAKFNRGLAAECRAYRELDAAGRRWSKERYPHGYTSFSSITDLHRRSTGFEALQRLIGRQVTQFVKTLELDIGKGKLEMTDLWLNIMGPGSHHPFHLHPLSVISGTYYVEVPKGSGPFKVEDPRIASFMASPPPSPRARLENQRYVSLTTRPGDLLLFESWLKHEVPSNQSREERISVSFNYDWR